jgi:hypothetical protein
VVRVNVTDLSDSTLVMDAVQATTTSASKLTISVPLKYDADYKIQVYNTSATPTAANLIYEDFYEVRRPYVDPNTKATTATDIASYAANEQLARAIIDSIVTDGFYYKKKAILAIGNGSDFIPVWDNVKSILSVYENNVLVTAKTFELITAYKIEVGDIIISKDGNEIVKSLTNIELEGVYTVVTQEEYIVVDNIVASPFFENFHMAGNIYYSFFRALCSANPDIIKSNMYEKFNESSHAFYLRLHKNVVAMVAQ